MTVYNGGENKKTCFATLLFMFSVSFVSAEVLPEWTDGKAYDVDGIRYQPAYMNEMNSASNNKKRAESDARIALARRMHTEVAEAVLKHAPEMSEEEMNAVGLFLLQVL